MEEKIFNRPWNNKEIEILKENFEKFGGKKCIELIPQRSYNAIVKMAKQLNLETPYNKAWSSEEIALLQKKYPELGARGCEMLFQNRTYNSILCMAKKLEIECLTIANPNNIAEKRGREWSTKEVEILKEYYPKYGRVGTAEFLPGRTEDAIAVKAQKMEIQVEEKYLKLRKAITSSDLKSNNMLDNQIRNLYNNPKRKPGDIRNFAKSISRNEKWIYERATQLGLTKPKTIVKPWSDEELEILQQMSLSGLWAIQSSLKRSGFERSRSAIQSRMERMDKNVLFDTDKDPGYMTVSEISENMGVASKTVHKWIYDFDLKISHREKGNRAKYHISRRNFKKWIQNNMTMIHLHSVDKFWFVDLLTNP